MQTVRRIPLLTIEEYTAIDAAFWESVDKSGECWVWIGDGKHGPYGRFNAGPYPSRLPSLLAHRVAWMLRNGPIPRGKLICHHCDNPPCVRPEHLYCGTLEDNRRDWMARKNRRVLPPAEC